jgi:hypothetical protein
MIRLFIAYFLVVISEWNGTRSPKFNLQQPSTMNGMANLFFFLKIIRVGR